MDRLLTLIWLKLRMWRHGLRTGTGMAEALAGIGLSILSLMFSLGMMVGVGITAHIVLDRTEAGPLHTALIVLCYYCAVFAVVLPVLFGTERAGVPIRRLAIFPLSRGALYRLSLFASFPGGLHLLWLPSLLAAFLVAVVFHGVNPISWGAFLGVFGFCLLVWCHTALLVLQRLTARRNAKEILAVVTFVVLISISMVPAMLDSVGDEAREGQMAKLESMLPFLAAAASVLPPSLAADGLATAHSDAAALGFGALGWLAAWTAAGIALGYRLFARRLREGGAPATRSVARTRQDNPGIDRIRWLPAAARGVAAKDLHYLLRSSFGRLNLLTVPVVAIFIGLTVGKNIDQSFLGIDPASLLFLGVMLYASLFSTNLAFNAFAWERAGMRSYFMSPVDLRHVVLGKNLGTWLYNGILAVECVIAFALVAGPPALPTLASGTLAFAAAALGNTIAGNFVSAAFPVARDVSKIANSPSQIGFIASIGVLTVVTSAIMGLAVVSSMTAGSWTLPILLSLLLVVEIGIYVGLSGLAARFLANRRARLIEAAQVAI